MKCFDYATRFDLSDEEYALLKPFLPPERSGKAGRPWAAHRKTLDGIFWILRTGAPWRDLPQGYGPFSTVHNRLTRWRQEGRWQKILDKLEALARKLGRLDFSMGDLDGSVIRAHKAAAGAKKKAGANSGGKPPSAGVGPKSRWADDQDPPPERGPRQAHYRPAHAGPAGRSHAGRNVAGPGGHRRQARAAAATV